MNSTYLELLFLECRWGISEQLWEENPLLSLQCKLHMTILLVKWKLISSLWIRGSQAGKAVTVNCLLVFAVAAGFMEVLWGLTVKLMPGAKELLLSVLHSAQCCPHGCPQCLWDVKHGSLFNCLHLPCVLQNDISVGTALLFVVNVFFNVTECLEKLESLLWVKAYLGISGITLKYCVVTWAAL